MSKVLLISDQPVLLRGFGHVLATRGFEVEASESSSLPEPDKTAGKSKAPPDLVLLDITAGLSFAELTEINGRFPGCPVVLWAESMPLDMVFRALEFGVRGIVERSSTAEHLSDSLRRVAGGEMQIGFTAVPDSASVKRRGGLTPREREIVTLLKQGLRNKQIANEMSITEGTVKIYLFRLFHKLGVRNRFELARCGLSEQLPAAPPRPTVPAAVGARLAAAARKQTMQPPVPQLV